MQEPWGTSLRACSLQGSECPPEHAREESVTCEAHGTEHKKHSQIDDVECNAQSSHSWHSVWRQMLQIGDYSNSHVAAEPARRTVQCTPLKEQAQCPPFAATCHMLHKACKQSCCCKRLYLHHQELVVTPWHASLLHSMEMRCVHTKGQGSKHKACTPGRQRMQ